MELAEVEVIVRAVLAPFERDMARAMNAVDAFDRNAQRGFTQSGRAVGMLNQQMGGTLTILRRMQRLAGLAIAGFAGNQIIQLANTWTDLNSRVNIAVGSIAEGAAVMDRLEKVARRTYSSLNLTVESFLGASSALRQLGYSTQTQLDFTEALNNALVVSGAKGERAAAVLNALSKAFAFGQLRGDELNSVLKVGGRVAEALAAGLGVSTNALRKMGADGLLTTDKLIRALLSQLELLRKEADSMPATVGDAFVIMQNALLRFVGTAALASGVTTRLGTSIINVADHIKAVSFEGAAFKTVSNALVSSLTAMDVAVNALFAHGGLLLSVFGTLGTVVVVARVAVMGLTAAVWLFTAALRVNPFVLAAMAAIALKDRVVEASGSIVTLGDKAIAAWQVMQPPLTSIVNSITGIFDALVNVGDQLVGTSGQFTSFGDFISKSLDQAAADFSNLLKTVAGVAAALDVAFANFPAALKAIVIEAINGAITELEKFLTYIRNDLRRGLGLENLPPVNLFPPIVDTDADKFVQSMEDAYNKAYDRVDRVARANAKISRNDAVEAGRNRAAVPGVGDVDNVAERQLDALTKGQKAYQNLTKAATDRIATLRTELALVGQSPLAIERARFAQELLNDATDKGGTVSAAQRKEIEALATTFAQLSSQLAAARIAQEVLQQRVLMFGTTMQRIVADLRAQGVDVESVQGKWLAGQIALNEHLATARGLAGDFASGLKNDLQKGVRLFDALTSAAQRLQQRLMDMLLDAALNGLFAGIAGGFGGGAGGGFGGIIAGLFGGGATGEVGPGGGPPERGPVSVSRPVNQVIGGGAVQAGGFAPRRAVVPVSPNGGGSNVINLNVQVSGARGNAEIQEMVGAGVSQGLDLYSRGEGDRTRGHVSDMARSGKFGQIGIGVGPRRAG